MLFMVWHNLPGMCLTYLTVSHLAYSLWLFPAISKYLQNHYSCVAFYKGPAAGGSKMGVRGEGRGFIQLFFLSYLHCGHCCEV